jgi:MFS family permease
MIPGSLSLISSSINENERGKAIGTWSAITTVVTMGGPILGGTLADAGLWRYIFFINVPIGIIALIILAFKVNESRDEDADKAVDIAGAASIALSLALLTFGFLRIPAVGFKSPQVYLTLLGGVILLIVFLVIEKKNKRPMMPLYLFSNPVFTGVNLLTFFLYAGLGAGMLFLSLNLVQVQGYSQLQSGLTFLPFTVLMITIARFAGTLADKYGPRLLLIIGPATAGAGLLLLSFIKQTAGPAEYWTTFFPGIIVFGLGMSFTVAPLTATVMTSVSDHLSGTASGVNNALTRIANVFANAIFGALAVLLFAGALQDKLQSIHLDIRIKQAVVKEAANLGNAKVPKGVDSKYSKIVSDDYRDSFIHAYSGIMKISAGLGFLGALMTMIFIRKEPFKKE